MSAPSFCQVEAVETAIWLTEVAPKIPRIGKRFLDHLANASNNANPELQVKIRGVDVFHPNTGEVRSDGPEGIACWFIDTDYNEESFRVRHAHFLGANAPYKALKTPSKPKSTKKPGPPSTATPHAPSTNLNPAASPSKSSTTSGKS